MGSLILNINNRILNKSVRYVLNKNGAFQQFTRNKHVSSHAKSLYLLHHCNKSNLKTLTFIRFASTVNVIETKPKVESLSNSQTNPSQSGGNYSVESNADQNFFIVRDKGKGTEEITNAGKPEIQIDESVLPPVPTPPTDEFVTIGKTVGLDPETVSKLIEAGIEPSLADLGMPYTWYNIASNLRCLLEYWHVDCGLPWWGSIVVTTIIIRTLFLPIFLTCRRHMINFGNLAPKMQEYQFKANAAKMAGDNMQAAMVMGEMMEVMKQMNMAKVFLPMMVQVCTFLPFFTAIRSMAKLPVESLKTGGMFWFTDLTVPDQFYILPLTTGATLGLMIFLGSESIKVKDVQSNLAKGMMIAMPVIVVVVMANNPAALAVYWTTTNFFSLGQSLIVKIPAVKEYFQIPDPIQHKKVDMTQAPSQFIKNVKESYHNTKILKEVQNIDRMNQMMFEKAGQQPIVRTFKRNPLLAKSADEKNR